MDISNEPSARACATCADVCTAWSRNAGVSWATGCRYLRENTDVLAEQVPDLRRVLRECQADLPRVILDETPVETDRIAGAHMNSGVHIRMRRLGCTSRTQSSERHEYAGRAR
jgi:hypothetical protein